MTKTLTALAAASAVALATLAVPTTAEARCFGCAVGAGVVGGVIAGAIVGGAIANSAPPPAYYGPGPAPGYGAPGVAYRQPIACANGPGFWAPRQWVGPDGYQHVSDRQFFWCP
jgi:hypothetical protein